MKDLKSFTKEELLRELESREKPVESSEQNYIYVGIVDDEGVEGMILVERAEDLRLDQLQLRARFNSHRNPVVYSVKMPKRLAEIMGEKIRNGHHVAVAKSLRSLSTFRSLGF